MCFGLYCLQASTLTKKYTEFLQRGEVKAYLDQLAEDGLNWWFKMEVPCIALHLEAVREQLHTALPHSLRLRFLVEATGPEIYESSMSTLYDQALEDSDWEVACAIVGAGIGAVWDSGYDFRRFDPWMARINFLLGNTDKVSALARASVLGFLANAHMNGDGDLAVTRKTCHQQLLAAEEAHSSSLRIFHAAMQTYCHLWNGHLARAEVLLKDADYLCTQDDASIIAQVFLHSSQGLFHAINGDAETGRKILENTVALPFFKQMPSSVWLLTHANLLFAIANCEDKKALETIAEKIRQHVVPRQNAFHHSYAHFSLGIASLELGEAHRALAHAEQAIDRGIAAHSAVTQRMPVLLKGQALADLGRDDEALSLFEEWMERWQHAGYNTVAATAAQEAALILLRQKQPHQAAQWYERALAVMPAGEKIPFFHRPPQMGEQLRAALLEEAESVQNLAAVRIYCFGSLRIEIGKKTIYDRKWRGGRSKALIKALVVHGGTKIPMTQLTDLLWPDSEGDQAYQNLKVLIWRLRHLGLDDGEKPQPWLQLQHGHLSLIEKYCAVDTFKFRSELCRSLRPDHIDWPGLKTALDMYTGDFLSGDASETWIIECRERLRRRYLEGVLVLATSAPDLAAHIDSESYLRRALEIDPLDERIYEQLMQLHLHANHPARALETYHHAQRTLKQGLGIEPGPTLVELARQAAGNA